MELMAAIVKIRRNKSGFSNEPKKMVISAANPLNPGSPSDANPPITKATPRNGITFINPPISLYYLQGLNMTAVHAQSNYPSRPITLPAGTSFG